MPRTEEYRRVVDACGDGSNPGEQAHYRRDDGNSLLQAREDDGSADLNRIAIPIELTFRIDPELIEVIQADRLDTTPPLRLGSIGQDLMAFSTAARRLSISAILSAILPRI